MPGSTPLSDNEKRPILDVFEDCSTIADLKRTRSNLIKTYHPDQGMNNVIVPLLKINSIHPFMEGQLDLIECPCECDELTLPQGVELEGQCLRKLAPSLRKLIIQTDLNQSTSFTIGDPDFEYIQLTEVHFDNPYIRTIPPDFLQYCTSITTISGLEEVITLGDSCFIDCKSIIEINLPNVTDVGASVFSNCMNLTKINLPNAINIGPTAFSECVKLESIILPNVTHLRSGAFKGCVNLKTISLPNVEFIESGAFRNCINLQSIKLPNSIEYVGDQAFANCANLNNILIPKACTQLLDKAFNGGTPLPPGIIHHRNTDINKIEFTKLMVLKPSTSIVSIDLNLDPLLDIFGTTISCDALGVFVSLHSINHESMLINVLNSNAEYKEAVIKVSLIVT